MKTSHRPSFFSATILIAFLFLVPLPASATLIGDAIVIQRGNTTPVGVTVIDPGIEFSESPGGLSLTIDVFASSFTLTYLISGPGPVGASTSWTLSELDWVDDPTGGLISNVVLLSAATQNGVTVSGLTFSDSLGVDSGLISFDTAGAMVGTSTGATSVWSFQITATHPSAIPEPATLALFAFGLAGLGFMTRRRRRDATAA